MILHKQDIYSQTIFGTGIHLSTCEKGFGSKKHRVKKMKFSLYVSNYFRSIFKNKVEMYLIIIIHYQSLTILEKKNLSLDSNTYPLRHSFFHQYLFCEKSILDLEKNRETNFILFFEK